MDRNQIFVLRWMLCGALIGAGAILPGVSGGVLAVIFGVYRPFMEVLTVPGKAIPKYWKGFIPLVLGWCAGFMGFAKGIALAFASAQNITTCLFLGLILGTMPALFREAGKEGHPKSGWAAMLFCAAAVFVMLYYVSHISKIQLPPNVWTYNFCGVLLGMGIIVPGMTTSAILMSLGLYQPLLNGLARMDLVVLLACLPGMLITMALLARGVRWLFRCHYAVAFHGILGIVLASAVMIVPMEYQGIAQAAACTAAAVFGAWLAYILARLEDKTGYVEK